MKGGLTKRLLAGRKTRHESSIARSTEVIEGGRFSWTDMQNPDRGDVEELAQRYGFNELNVEDCLTKSELPKLDGYDDHFFVILHFPPLAAKRSQRYSQLSVFMGRDFLVTMHQGDLRPLVDLIAACRGSSDPERGSRLMGGSPAILLHEIIDVLVDDLLHTSRRIIANLDDIEDGVFDESKSAARSISILRREINMLRRIVNPLKKFVLEIGTRAQAFSGSGEEDLGLYFDDVIDHIDKVLESLEESRETMEIYKDTDFMLSTEKTNKVLAALTIIFTLAIPSTVIGTFYGMNVSLPGAGSAGAALLGEHQAFIVILLASAVPAALMAAFFKRMGWIGR